jgi:hypothetical protein
MEGAGGEHRTPAVLGLAETTGGGGGAFLLDCGPGPRTVLVEILEGTIGQERSVCKVEGCEGGSICIHQSSSGAVVPATSVDSHSARHTARALLQASTAL